MRYLIFGGPGIGDTIIELAMAKGIKNQDSSAVVDLLTSNSLGTKNIIEEILHSQKWIDNHYSWTLSDKIGVFRTLLLLRKNKYDYGFSCSTEFKASYKPTIICKLIGCKSVIKEIPNKTGKIDIPVTVNENINFVEQYECILRKIFPDVKLDLLVLDKDSIQNTVFFSQNERPQITICLGANITYYYDSGKKIAKNIKEWPVERWVELANKLGENNYNVVLLGGKQELRQLEPLHEKLHSSVLNLCGKTTVSESLSVLNESDAVVGADTGMMHCAAALDKITVSLFGGTDYRVWRPYSPKNIVVKKETACAPCYGKEIALKCQKRICMLNIGVNEVYGIVTNIFRRK